MGKIDVQQLATLRLGHGTIGPNPCVMQAIAKITGDTKTMRETTRHVAIQDAEWAGRTTDRPSCMDPALTTLGITINDSLFDDDRQRLRAFIPRLIGTRDDGHANARAIVALNTFREWIIVHAPEEVADLARAIPPITSAADARESGDAASRARMKLTTEGTPETIWKLIATPTPWNVAVSAYQSATYALARPTAPSIGFDKDRILAAPLAFIANARFAYGVGSATLLELDPDKALAYLDDLLRVGEMAPVSDSLGVSEAKPATPYADAGYTPFAAPEPLSDLICVEPWA